MEKAAPPATGADIRPARGFSTRTRRMLVVMRVVAYSAAPLFMLVMIVRGVSLTAAQMEAEAERSVRAAVLAASQPGMTGSALQPLLAQLAAPGVSLAIADDVGEGCTIEVRLPHGG